MSARQAPTAIRMPTSLMRSDTELSIMFMTPTPAIITASAAIAVSSRFSVLWVFLAALITSVRETTEKSSTPWRAMIARRSAVMALSR